MSGLDVFLKDLRTRHPDFLYGLPIKDFLKRLGCGAAPKVENKNGWETFSLKSIDDWTCMLDFLKQTSGMEKAAELHANADVLKGLLRKICRGVEKLAGERPEVFDEGSSEWAAHKITGLLSRLYPLLQYCAEHGNSAPHQRLEQEAEAYMAPLGITRLRLKEGLPVEEWIDLEIRGDRDIVYIKPNSPEQSEKISKIIVNPFSLAYVNANDEKTSLNFCGRCKAYEYYDG